MRVDRQDPEGKVASLPGLIAESASQSRLGPVAINGWKGNMPSSFSHMDDPSYSSTGAVL